MDKRESKKGWCEMYKMDKKCQEFCQKAKAKQQAVAFFKTPGFRSFFAAAAAAVTLCEQQKIEFL